MPLTKDKKTIILQELSKSLSQSDTILFTNFSDMDVEKIKELRNALQAEGATYYIAKKSLLHIALKQAKIDIGDIDFKKHTGSIGIVFGKNDQIMPTRITHLFAKAKENKKSFILLGAAFDGESVDVSRLALLAKATSKEDLLSGLLRQFIAPISKFVYVLAAISEKKS